MRKVLYVQLKPGFGSFLRSCDDGWVSSSLESATRIEDFQAFATVGLLSVSEEFRGLQVFAIDEAEGRKIDELSVALVNARLAASTARVAMQALRRANLAAAVGDGGADLDLDLIGCEQTLEHTAAQLEQMVTLKPRSLPAILFSEEVAA